MAEKSKGPTDEELLQILLEKKILSGAQVEVAKIDSASSGLSSADVLLARKWITEQTLAEFYSTNAHSPPTSSSALPGAKGAESDEQIYLQNLRNYRQLMSKIMGETD